MICRMTNHPGRRRGDDEEPQSVQEMAGEMDAQMPPGHTPNGVPAGLKPDPVTLAAKAVAQTLGEHLPNMIFQAMAAALSQVQVTTQQHLCATCIIARIGWENSHRADMEAAMMAAAEAAGAEPGSPQAGQLELTPFLPPDLRLGERNGMPGVAQAVTTFQGTEVCPAHLPGGHAARSPLLVATAGMSPAMAARFTGTG